MMTKRPVASVFAFTSFALTFCAHASHGPFPPSPEANVQSATMNIYSAPGSALHTEDITGAVNDIFGFGLYGFESPLGQGYIHDGHTYGIWSPPGTYTFDYADGDTTNGIETPFVLEVGTSQAAYQLLWDFGGSVDQVVIGLLDITPRGGNLFSVTSVDTDPLDFMPGTPFQDGPLAGYTVEFDMLIQTPAPATVWLFASGLLALARTRTRRNTRR